MVSLPPQPSTADQDSHRNSVSNGLSSREDKSSSPQTEAASSANKLIIVRAPSSHKRPDLQLQAINAGDVGAPGGVKRSMTPLYTLHQRTVHSSVVLDAATDDAIAKLSLHKKGGIEMHDLGFLELEAQTSASTSKIGRARRSPSLTESASSSERGCSTPIQSTFLGRLWTKARRSKQQADPSSTARVQQEGAHNLPRGATGAIGAFAEAGNKYTFSLKKDAKSRDSDATFVWRQVKPSARLQQSHQSSSSCTPPRSRSHSNASGNSQSPLPSPSLFVQPRSLSRCSSFAFLGPPIDTASHEGAFARSARSASMSASSSATSTRSVISGREPAGRDDGGDGVGTEASSLSLNVPPSIPQPSYGSTWTCHLSSSSRRPGEKDLLLATLVTVLDHAQLAAKLSLNEEADLPDWMTDRMGPGYEVEEIEDCVGVMALWLTARG